MSRVRSRAAGSRVRLWIWLRSIEIGYLSKMQNPDRSNLPQKRSEGNIRLLPFLVKSREKSIVLNFGESRRIFIKIYSYPFFAYNSVRFASSAPPPSSFNSPRYRDIVSFGSLSLSSSTLSTSPLAAFPASRPWSSRSRTLSKMNLDKKSLNVLTVDTYLWSR